MSDGSGGKSAAEMAQAEMDLLLSRPIRAACSFCPWSYEGIFGDARELSEAHRQEAHPEAKPVISRRKRRTLTLRQPRLSDAELEEIEVERRRRAAALGIDLGP